MYDWVIGNFFTTDEVNCGANSMCMMPQNSLFRGLDNSWTGF